MKRLLILGGSDLQVSLIKQAKSLGHYVVTCDYLPNNPGHKFSDEYHNVSTTDKVAVLELAKQLHLDGILAYASDPAAPTAAWVCEELNLPSNSFKAVEILSRKDLFRAFMETHGFRTPKSKSFTSYTKALAFFNKIHGHAIIKPVDSSGSKGVYKIIKGTTFQKIFEISKSFSKQGLVIIEEKKKKKGYQIGGDGFLVNGELVFRCFGDIHFSKTNPLLPCSVSVPTLHSNDIVLKVHQELQKLLSAIGMKMGGLNFDVIIDKNDEVHIIEIGPRNGGNLIPELTEHCTGVDMKFYAIKSALGEDCSELAMKTESTYFSHYVIHSQKTGKLISVEKSDTLKQHIIYEHYNFEIGQTISKFENSSNRLGVLILKYKCEKDMLDIIYHMDEHFKFHFYEA